jgi:hypothetical protein
MKENEGLARAAGTQWLLCHSRHMTASRDQVNWRRIFRVSLNNGKKSKTKQKNGVLEIWTVDVVAWQKYYVSGKWMKCKNFDCKMSMTGIVELTRIIPFKIMV